MNGIGMNVDLKVDNVDDKYNSKDSISQPRKSSAVISGATSDRLGPKTYVTIQSPFTKGKISGLSPKSDRTSIDSAKSNNSGWRADKYVPNNYQIKNNASNRRSRFKLIRMDWNELNSCGTYSRIVTAVFSLFIIIIIVLNMNSEDSNDDLSVEEINPNNTMDKDELKPMSLIVEDYAKYFLIIICVMAMVIETGLIVAYSFHIVEMMSQWPWLWLESSYATVFALNFMVLSVWMLFYDFWSIIVSFIGIIITFIYIIWAIIKINRYRSGQLAQQGSDDPDGDTLRRLSPNFKFLRSNQELSDKLNDDRKIQNKDDILY